MTLLRRMIDELRVTSCVNHHFDNVGFGEASIAIHADNCTSQNNNNFLLAYIIWRILTERNRSVKFCFRQPHKHHKGVVHVCMWVYCKRVWINLLNSIAYLWSLFSALVTRTQLYSPVALSCCLCCNLIPAVLYTGLWHVVQLPSKSNTDPLIIRKRTETSSRTAVISTFEKKPLRCLITMMPLLTIWPCVGQVLSPSKSLHWKGRECESLFIAYTVARHWSCDILLIRFYIPQARDNHLLAGCISCSACITSMKALRSYTETDDRDRKAWNLTECCFYHKA